MIEYREEVWKDTLPEIMKFLPDHYIEDGEANLGVPFDPRLSLYQEMANKGGILLVTARKDGKVVGYFIGFLSMSLHSKDTLMCQGDGFYVSPAERGQNIGFNMFRKVEEICRSKGVKLLFVGYRIDMDASFLFDKLGYKEVERYYEAKLA